MHYFSLLNIIKIHLNDHLLPDRAIEIDHRVEIQPITASNRKTCQP